MSELGANPLMSTMLMSDTCKFTEGNPPGEPVSIYSFLCLGNY
jgi:hypothetical protein